MTAGAMNQYPGLINSRLRFGIVAVLLSIETGGSLLDRVWKELPEPPYSFCLITTDVLCARMRLLRYVSDMMSSR